MPIKVKNVAMGFWRNGIFHPVRASHDYDPERAGEDEDAEIQPLRLSKKQSLEAAKHFKRAYLERKKAEREQAKKKAAKKATKKAAKKAAKKATRKNPIPTNRYVDAKIRRTPRGDIKVILPLR